MSGDTKVQSQVGFGSLILSCPHHLGLNLGNADCSVLPVEGIHLDVIQAPKADLKSCRSREQ
jgi:hypothetical protein